MNKVRQLREAESLRQQDMAKMLGMSVSTYSKKENGMLRFSLKDAKMISDYFNKSMETIFFENDISKMESICYGSIIPLKEGEINGTNAHESGR